MRYYRLGTFAALVIIAFAQLSPAETLVEGPVSGIWDLEGSPYIVVGEIYVWQTDTLIIEPLVEVRFNPGLSFTVYGTLLAEGGPGSLITFTSNLPNPVAGDWGSITFYSTEPQGSVLDYCEIAYGGSTDVGNLKIDALCNPTLTHCLIHQSSSCGISCYNGTSPLIADCIIRNNERHGITCESGAAPEVTDNTFVGNSYALYVDGTSQPELDGNTATGNDHDGVEMYGSLTVDGHWSDLPSYLSDNLSVEQGVTLTIDPGHDVILSPRISLNVYGALQADGTPAAPITFTSEPRSSEYGRWGSVGLLNPSTGNLIDCCIFEYGGSTGHGLVFCEASEAAIANSIIRHSPNAGIHAVSESNLTVTGTTFTGTEWPIEVHASCLLTLAGNTAEGNEHDGIAIWDVARNGSTWYPDLPYFVTDQVVVEAGDTLTILAGTEIRFMWGRGLAVYGTLLAPGTPSDSVLFTSAQPSPVGGDWNALEFHDNSSSGSLLEYCDIRYGGANGGGMVAVSHFSHPSFSNCRIARSAADGIECIDRAYPTLSACTIEENDRHGIFLASYSHPEIRDCRFYSNEFAIYADGQVTPTLERNAAYGNLHDGVGVSGSLSSDVTWSNLPHIVRSGMDIEAPATLTIDPGVEVLFYTDALINVYGNLIADGELTRPILFSYEPGPSERGRWGHIGFLGSVSDQNLLDFCTIEYGGSDGLGCLYFDAFATGTITRSKIWANLSHGIECRDHASPSLAGCSILDNVGSGIRTQDSSAPTISYSNIAGNFLYGVENLDPLLTIDAEDNWWGSPTGPGGAGPGTGDSVTAWVDYEPWSDAPHLPDVMITLAPDTLPLIIPPQGGSFGYDAEVINRTLEPQVLAAWIGVRLPNGTAYGPLLGPVNLNLAPEETLRVHLDQAVPAPAPPGYYRFSGYLGTYPSPASGYSSFPFEKSGPIDRRDRE